MNASPLVVVFNVAIDRSGPSHPFWRGPAIARQADPHHRRVALDPVGAASALYLRGDPGLAGDILKPGQPFGRCARCLDQIPPEAQGKA